MSALYPPGATVDVTMGIYACEPPARNDVALVRAAGRGAPLLKQVLIIPGDRFRLAPTTGGDAELYVNDVRLVTPTGEAYRFAGKRREMIALYETDFKGVMPADTYFVFGTDAAGTLDSSRFGPVPREDLLGRVNRGTAPSPRP